MTLPIQDSFEMKEPYARNFFQGAPPQLLFIFSHFLQITIIT